MRIKTAVIPAAGLGTRFLPATKTVPKEMLPLVDRPLISFVVEEALAAGIDHVVLITGRNKHAIDDFFDTAYELEHRLASEGKQELLQLARHWSSTVRVTSIRQKEPLGLGHAILCARHAVGEHPFAVLLGDEVMRPQGSGPLPTEQLCREAIDSSDSCVSVMKVEASEVGKYGVIEIESELARDHFRVARTVEKPAAEKAPSMWALPGRYVFQPEIFDHLAQTRPGKNGEIQLTDAMDALAQKGRLRALGIQCRRYDAGDKFGFLQANIEMGLEHPDTRDALLSYLRQNSGRLW